MWGSPCWIHWFVGVGAVANGSVLLTGMSPWSM